MATAGTKLSPVPTKLNGFRSKMLLGCPTLVDGHGHWNHQASEPVAHRGKAGGSAYPFVFGGFQISWMRVNGAGLCPSKHGCADFIYQILGQTTP